MQFEKAFLHDYARFSILNGSQVSEYPVLKPMKGCFIEGLVIYPLTKIDLKILTYYEGEEYFSKKIKVILKGKSITTNTYYPVEINKIDFGSEWLLNVFKEKYLDTYLKETIPQMLLDYNTDILG